MTASSTPVSISGAGWVVPYLALSGSCEFGGRAGLFITFGRGFYSLHRRHFPLLGARDRFCCAQPWHAAVFRSRGSPSADGLTPRRQKTPPRSHPATHRGSHNFQLFPSAFPTISSSQRSEEEPGSPIYRL